VLRSESEIANFPLIPKIKKIENRLIFDKVEAYENDANF